MDKNILIYNDRNITEIPIDKPKLQEEWGGSLCAIIDGKKQNIAEYLNKRYRKQCACSSTEEL